MAVACACDRCGELFIPENKYVDVLFVGEHLVSAGCFIQPTKKFEIDLCPNCMENFNKWLEKRNPEVKKV